MGSTSKLAFYNSSNIRQLILGGNVINIPALAFKNLSLITSITLPAGIKTIGDSAFSGCTSLPTLTIPESVTSLANNAFNGCTLLSTVYFNAVNCASAGNSSSASAFNGCTNIIVLRIGDKVTRLPTFIFISKLKIDHVMIPVNVINIDGSAFSSSSGMMIYCVSGSAAHTYAVTYKFPFTLIGIRPTGSATINEQNGFIVGIGEGKTSLDAFLSAFGGATITAVPSGSTTFGTDSTVKLTYDGITAKTYTIVVFGDVNGDGNVDSIDAGKFVDHQNYIITWDPTADAALYKAGDLNGDGNIDSIDAGLVVDAQNYMVSIDQTTGLAKPN